MDTKESVARAEGIQSEAFVGSFSAGHGVFMPGAFGEVCYAGIIPRVEGRVQEAQSHIASNG